MDAVAGKKIFIGLSGGVDSAVSAALLSRAGARVTGVFIKGWYPPGMPCTWAADRRDAMRVAAKLRIPFVTLDASDAYKRGVIEYLLHEYRSGRTPNPDVMCNREVKFGAFHDFALAQGADAIATGHYRDGEKDQSYFLWAVPKEALAKTVFPVGRMSKREVRALASRHGLPVAQKPDSQGVCFLGSVSVSDFLRSEFGDAPGVAYGIDGTRVGTHDGAHLFTIGERVSLRDAPPGPWYVTAKDIRKRSLVVTRERSYAGEAGSVRFTGANWHEDPSHVSTAQMRYRGAMLSGRVAGDTFIPDEPLIDAPAAGQSIAFYRAGGELAGGGIIT